MALNAEHVEIQMHTSVITSLRMHIDSSRESQNPPRPTSSYHPLGGPMVYRILIITVVLQ